MPFSKTCQAFIFNSLGFLVLVDLKANCTDRDSLISPIQLALLVVIDALGFTEFLISFELTLCHLWLQSTFKIVFRISLIKELRFMDVWIEFFQKRLWQQLKSRVQCLVALSLFDYCAPHYFVLEILVEWSVEFRMLMNLLLLGMYLVVGDGEEFDNGPLDCVIKAL